MAKRQVTEILLSDGWHRVREFRQFDRDYFSDGSIITEAWFDCFELDGVLLEGYRSSIEARRQRYPSSAIPPLTKEDMAKLKAAGVIKGL